MSAPAADAVRPPGLSKADFTKALQAFASALGEDAVLTAEQAAEFRDPYSYPGWDDHWPSAVVQPASTEDVQAVVRVARQYKVPLWTTSMGKNNAYGGPAPRVRGSVVVSMRRLNRVLEVNEELAYAVVEPGVSFFDLCAELSCRGSTLWASIPDLGWGSVIGNTVDHGVGYLPGGNHAESMCGMEVVLASGEVIRTGMGAMAGNHAWHAHRKGFGPAVDSLFMQSNLGIVTRMGKWLSPRPEVYAPVEVRAASESDLEALIDTMRPLLLDGGHLDFSPVAPLTGAHVRRLVTMIRPEIERAGLDFWPGTIMTPRSCYLVSPLLYDTTNEAQVKAAYDVYRRLVRLTGEAGYGLYRGHIDFMDDIAAQYGFNDHAMLRLYGTLKDALDPDGILSPGKQGIWPRASGQF